MAYPPSLPAEVAYSDLELDMIDNEPPGLFPTNQNSYYGQFRKTFADYLIVNAVNLFTRWYNNLDPRVVDDNDIDEWEYMTGTPTAPAGFTTAQRRSRVLSRTYRGAFTRTQRRLIVESFITATFGAAVSFDASGVPITSGGIPLYSGATSLAGTYAIRENDPSKNLAPNPNFETNLSGWAPGASYTNTRVTTQSKFGAASLKSAFTSGTDANITTYGFTFPAAGTYTVSAYVWIPAAWDGGMPFLTDDGSFVGATWLSHPVADTTKRDQWQRITGTISVVVGDLVGFIVTRAFGNVQPTTAGQFIYVDGAQVEVGNQATDWSDPTQQAFFYDVRILNTITVDEQGLRRELNRITPAGIAYTITYTATP